MHSEFVQLSQILRKNLLTCVLLGMQHSLFKLHSELGLGVGLKFDFSRHSPQGDDQPPARRESNRKKVNVKHHSSEDSKQDKAEEQLTDNADLVIDIVEENILSRVQHNDETWKAVDNTQKCSSQTYTRPIVTKLGPLTLKYGTRIDHSVYLPAAHHPACRRLPYASKISSYPPSAQDFR